ncbi:hypothetical protein [Nocardioides gilvus]|uniref:hypothetical protein n=1 Tax=Nocardioides gilvus TaxID=1735589 RepID=UPI000D746ED1|nr:hypothetical protein [Nocardioides gilvus]
MDELVVQPEALIRRAMSWEEVAEWLRDSERELAALSLSLSASGEAVRPAAARFWAAARGRTQAGVRAADGLAEALRGVVADVGDVDRRVAEGLGG